MKKEKEALAGGERGDIDTKVQILVIFLWNKSFCQFYAKKCRLIDKKLLSLYNDSSSKEH